MSRCQDVKMGKTNSFSDVVMGTGTWVWVPVCSHASHGDRHLGMGACFHGNFFAIFLMVS